MKLCISELQHTHTTFHAHLSSEPHNGRTNDTSSGINCRDRPGDMTGGDAVPLLLARLIRLSLALTPLLLVRAAPSASALSVRALLLARLLGPRPTAPVPELPAGSLARRELEA